MYKTPQTQEVIPTHPLELPRIEGVRPYGFDGLEVIHNRIVKLLEKNQNQPIAEVYKGKNKYLSLVVESKAGSAIPHNLVVIEVGYIDFQDGELVKMAGIEYAMYLPSGQVTLISATGETSHHSQDIESVIDEVKLPQYLELPDLKNQHKV